MSRKRELQLQTIAYQWYQWRTGALIWIHYTWLVLLFLALWFILRGDLLYVFPCVILFLCFLVLLVLRLPRLGKKELILVFFVRLFDLCLFGFVGFCFLLGSGKRAAFCDCGTTWTFLLPFFSIVQVIFYLLWSHWAILVILKIEYRLSRR